uniref:RRM domain-containing protein n=1 Tax=Poecilia reticulata TaxID=8081 RepID=A0A3P9NJM7_POERE
CQTELLRVQALEAWLETTNTRLTQVNGQRKYGGPPEGWNGPTPGEHCEVFISHIPRDAYEDLLIPLFSSVGSLWEFRLMMNFSGQNRGFAYAKYGTQALATEAVLKLNGYMLEPKCYLCVRRSTEKRHLCIGNLPAATKQEDLKQVRFVCEANGFGQPFYELHYSLARPDGFVKFTYKVLIPGIGSAFRGKVMVLPGPSVRVMLEEAQRAIAQQLLQRMFHNQQAA